MHCIASEFTDAVVYWNGSEVNQAAAILGWGRIGWYSIHKRNELQENRLRGGDGVARRGREAGEGGARVRLV